MIGLVCLVAGPFWGTTEWFAHHLHATLGFESMGKVEHHFDWATAITGTLAAVAGRCQLQALRPSSCRAGSPPGQPLYEPMFNRLFAGGTKPLYEASLNKFYVDEIYEWAVARPTRAVAILCDFFDAYFVDRLISGLPSFPGFSDARCWPTTRMG